MGRQIENYLNKIPLLELKTNALNAVVDILEKRFEMEATARLREREWVEQKETQRQIENGQNRRPLLELKTNALNAAVGIIEKRVEIEAAARSREKEWVIEGNREKS